MAATSAEGVSGWRSTTASATPLSRPKASTSVIWVTTLASVAAYLRTHVAGPSGQGT